MRTRYLMGWGPTTSMGFTFIFLVMSTQAALATGPFVSQCPNQDIALCQNVGKKAFNAFAIPTDLDLGPIVGVIWRNYGDPLKPDPTEIYHFSKKAAWYYIIGPGGVADYRFLRDADEINAK